MRRIRTPEGRRQVKFAGGDRIGISLRARRSSAAGADDFIRKPYRPSEIFDCMARHLGLRLIDGESQSEKVAAPLGKEHLLVLLVSCLR